MKFVSDRYEIVVKNWIIVAKSWTNILLIQFISTIGSVKN